ncbi:hypothetical protein F0919_05560 [Taibaiella lutea]|uniref:N-acetyltransferase domain-containing protein n=1 Tax=Taibaiella lutea TaxID=2608001 RepID=A0A5M6CVA3_9BACT|nr:hypothetical protein [Taibaiella lutea]KAA5537139.1 hypothetical protein F0919_05560 [Taibaiella lutea]
MIQIKPIQNKGSELRTFIDFPHDLYKDDPYYVPELFMAQRDLLSPKHPFFLHGRIQLFLAYQDNKVAGRIAAIFNGNHNDFNKVNDGFFGFFDVINNQEVANALLSAAEKWLKDQKVDSMIGPVNHSTNEACGLLVDGFDSSPMVLMTYNKPYYLPLLEHYGLTKQVDLVAYALYDNDLGDKPVRLQEALTQRLAQKGITIRSFDLKHNFKSELEKFGKVYNAAWDKNMGFVPMTAEEFNFMGKDLKMIADTDFCLAAEHNGEVVGIALCLPDINQVLKKIKRGRLFPTGIFKLLFGRKKINALRIIALGVMEPYRKMGIEACFYATIMKNGLGKGIKFGEASWMLEHNDMMNKAIEHMNGKRYKTYRLLEKKLNTAEN